MPIYHDFTPPIPERTEYIPAGAVTFGVEPRVLTQGMMAAYPDNSRFVDLPSIRALMADLEERGDVVIDSGVSIHVFSGAGDDLTEHLRFDCYHRRPHYHYYGPRVWQRKLSIRPEEAPAQHYVDTVANGDPVAWALERLRERLPQMLAHAGVPELARSVAPAAIETAMREVPLAAQRAQDASPRPG